MSDEIVAYPHGEFSGSEFLLSPESLSWVFMRPVFLDKSAWLEHIPIAFWLAGALKPRVFVELGTHTGLSYFAFCQAMERLSLDVRCFAVDTWTGDEHAGFYGEEVYNRVREYNEAMYSRFSRLVRSTFSQASEHFSDGSIDLLHIDGLHTEKMVRTDFEQWLPKLSDRAVVVFHDSNVRERGFGVFKLVEDLRSTYPCFEFIHGHGLAVLGVGPIQTEMLRGLYEASGQSGGARFVQEIFGRLGRSCADRFLMEREVRRTADLQRSYDRQKADADALRQALEKTKAEVASRAREARDLRARIEERIAKHAQERGQLLERVSILQEYRAEAQKETARLRASIADMEKAAVGHARERVEMERRHRHDQEALAGLNAKIADMEKAAAEAKIADMEKAAVGRGVVKNLEQCEKERASLLRKYEVRVQELTRLTKLQLKTENALKQSRAGMDVSSQANRNAARRVGDIVAGLCGISSETPMTKWRIGRLAARLEKAGIVDRAWYLRQNPDVTEAGMDPVRHYLLHGMKEGREPRDLFKPATVKDEQAKES